MTRAPLNERAKDALSLLKRAAERIQHGLHVDVNAGTCRFNNRQYSIRARRATNFQERTLEIIKAFLFDSRIFTQEKRTENSFLLIHVNSLPTGRHIKDQIEKLYDYNKNDAPWAIVSDNGGCYLPFTKNKKVTIPDTSFTSSRTNVRALRVIKNPLGNDVALTLLSFLLLERTQVHARLDIFKIRERRGSVADLAKQFKVSTSSLYNAIDALKTQQWITMQRGELPRITDHEAFMKVVNWFKEFRKHAREPRLMAVPLYNKSWVDRQSLLKWLHGKKQNASMKWAVTGWYACALHKSSVLVDEKTKPLEIVVNESVSAVMHEWELKEAQMMNGDYLSITTTPHPLATFSFVTTINQLPVVDPWQAALDVVGDPQRGEEQATAIAGELWLAK